MGITGKMGEDYVARWYEQAGCQIIERNFHTRYGEVDIIAADEAYIIFVEVKTRSINGLTHPAEAVTRQKQQKLIKSAQIYLQAHPGSSFQPRFDVVSVFTAKEHIVKLECIKNAFFGP